MSVGESFLVQRNTFYLRKATKPQRGNIDTAVFFFF